MVADSQKTELSVVESQGGIMGAKKQIEWRNRDSREGKREWADDGQKVSTPMGLEPTTFGSEVRRAIHCATKPTYLSNLPSSLR